ncbi:hypothetical protein [Actinobacillus pleuropneumoniae]|uniref:Lipoprotein n=1 Tax=Actinobacillus pleuropneumoniae TaxID=715 RepID=A0A448TXR4_ACTPL|nr:hypothetical protein [Actinobacillus pleuropneumoniae]VEJ16425.1 Uncharacterised protein [Actinobacillus pleuropneumoniae]
MNKLIFTLLVTSLLSACSTQYPIDYTTKPVFCYQLSPQDIQPGKNCIGTGGHN